MEGAAAMEDLEVNVNSQHESTKAPTPVQGHRILNEGWSMSTSYLCYAVGCTNSGNMLASEVQKDCPIHNCKKGSLPCVCPPPFRHINFPPRLQAEKRAAFIKPFKRLDPSDPHRLKLLEPRKGHRVCSDHFVDGQPTDAHPYPELKLGHEKFAETCTLSNDRRKERALKRHKRAAEQQLDEAIRESGFDEMPREGTEMPVDEMDFPHTPNDAPYAIVFLIMFIGLLYEKVKELVKEIGELRRHNRRLRTELDRAHSKNATFMKDNQVRMSAAVLRNDSDCRFYTGISKLGYFNVIHNLVKGKVRRRWQGKKKQSQHNTYKRRSFIKTPKKFGPQTKLSCRDEMLLTFMKLRLALLNEDLACRFHISSTLVSKIFNSWLTALYKTFGKIVHFYSLEHVRATRPARFCSLPYLRAIIDCTEIFIETPKNLNLQNKTWSNYKHHNTAKVLVACAPNSMITYVSKAYGGRISDSVIVQKTGFLELLEPYEMVMADKGFPIGESCEARNIELYKPPGQCGAIQMSISSVNKTKRCANVRILIEQVIRRMKTFHIIKHEVPLSLLPSLDKMVTVIAATCNLMRPYYDD